MDVEAVGNFSGYPAHVITNPGDINRYLPVLHRGWAEERRHQAELIEITLEGQLVPGLPGAPDRPQRLDVLPEAGPRAGPRHVEPTDDVGPHLGPEAEQEPSLGQLGQIPRRIGNGHR